jgi:hypothetical protein
MARRYGQKPSSWLIPPSLAEHPEGLMRAFDFDQTVMLLAVNDEQEQRARDERNREALKQNNERRRAMGLPLEAAPLA